MPSLLPGGSRFLFLVHSSKADSRGVWVSSLKAPGNRKRVLEDVSNAAYANGYLLFVRGGALMAQPFDPGRSQLSGTAEVIVPKIGYAPSNGTRPSVSPQAGHSHGRQCYRLLPRRV